MNLVRRVAYVSGTRADFGLMRASLAAIHATPELSLSIYATGMHLDPNYGQTISEIEQSGLPSPKRIDVEIGVPSGARTAKNLGLIVGGLVDAFVSDRPDIVLLLGDRGEMLAAAIAAIHLNIPIAHLHGGERSGTVDEPVRHAISKLAHIHLVASEASKERLLRMGEQDERIFVVGAPGLDGILDDAALADTDVFLTHGLDPRRPVALFVYHPVLQEADRAGVDASMALDELKTAGLQILALRPNSDAGSLRVVEALTRSANAGDITLVTHLPRAQFLQCLSRAAVLVGNSSSGIIEAASFGTPVVNIGSRQNLRERNVNVIDVAAEPGAIRSGIAKAIEIGRFAATNIYGDGKASSRIVARLKAVDLDNRTLLMKTNAY